MWENIELIKDIIKNSINKTDVLLKLGLKNNGGNYNTLSSFINRNEINVTHFNSKMCVRRNKKEPEYKSLDEILVLNSKFVIGSHSLKLKLYKRGLKYPICELCGQDENWRGKKMSLILDHISGNRYDNRLENLRIVCPNCNATLETHCRGLNIKKENIYTSYDTCLCGERKKKESNVCIKCYNLSRTKDKKINISRRKVSRPPYKQLLDEIDQLGYIGTGKKYNVSDNSIRKWVKMFEKHGEDF